MAMSNKRVFQLIDLDRTLFDTSRFIRLISDVVNQREPGLGNEIDARFEAMYQKEETFFVLEFLRQKLGKPRYDALVRDALRDIDVSSLLLPGVQERLAFAETLSETTPGYGILTYTLYPEDQALKVELVGLDHIPMYIGDTPDKAELISSWQNDDGTFQLPEEFGGQIVDELTFEDDKLRAFIGLPEHTHGVWITHYDDADERLAATGLTNVAAARGMEQSIELLKTKFS